LDNEHDEAHKKQQGYPFVEAAQGGLGRDLADWEKRHTVKQQPFVQSRARIAGRPQEG